MKMKLQTQLHRCMGAMAIALPGMALAQTQNFEMDSTLVQSVDGRMVSYAEVLEPSRKAVVSVTTASIVESMGSRGRSPIEEFMRRFYGLPPQDNGEPQGPSEERRIPNGLGSGVIISSDGYILTNNHVVTDDAGEPADEITVYLNDDEEVTAELVGRDDRTDIALLKIDREDLPFLRMADSDNLRVGDIVFAIGNPLGVGQTSTMGIVSAIGRTNLGLLGNQGYENFIQTDAAINRGNSGGALVDAEGRLVGINTAIYSQTGGNIGIGFAIPSRLARTVMLELIETGTVRRGYLGVSIRDLDRELAEAFNMDRPRGALVESVQPGTPADSAGIQRGDVIVRLNNREVEDVADLRLTVAAMRPGEEVGVTIHRDGDKEELVITLGSLDDPLAVVASEDSPLDGIGLSPLTEAMQLEWDLEPDEGVVVTEVNARSPYSTTLARGMVILEVNDTPVTNVGELTRALREGRVNKLWVWFRGNEGFVALRVE